MAQAILDMDLLARFLGGRNAEKFKEPEKSSKLFAEQTAPVKEKSGGKETIEATPSHNIFSLQAVQRDLPACGIGDFIGVIYCSFGAGLYEEQRPPYPQVWFTDEEAAEKCIERGYALTTDGARKFLGQILERGHRLIEYRNTIGRIEYRRVTLDYESAKKYFGVEAPSLKCKYPPPQEYRTRYGRNNHQD